MSKLLIGYDGSEFANAAIDDLRRAGLGNDVEAIVLTSADVWPALLDGESKFESKSGLAATARALSIAAMNEAHSISHEGRGRVKALFPDWKVTAEALPDSPGRVLVERAETWRPDLIVIGARGRSAAAQFVEWAVRGVGSVAQNVVRFAPCSVRIGRPATGAAVDTVRPAHIIVGIDGSAESAAAVQAVAMRHWPDGSETRVITVLDVRGATSTSYLLTSVQFAEARQDDGTILAQQAVDRCAEQLRDSGLIAAPIVLQGDPKTVLIEEAKHWPADCIFVGAQGMGRIERFMLGSVSGTIAERASCSVEVVRHPGSSR